MADNTTLNAGVGGDVIASDDVSGVKYQRVKNCYGADGTATDVAAATPMPMFQTNTGRNLVHLWALGVASGTTGTETAITLTKSAAPGAATSSGASLTVTNAKRFRITSMTFASRGHSTGTAQVTTFALRVNTAGATTTSSNIMWAARTATPATALAWDRAQFFFDDMGVEIVGDGTLTFGVTANAVFTTNAPTWDVAITGYEY